MNNIFFLLLKMVYEKALGSIVKRRRRRRMWQIFIKQQFLNIRIKNVQMMHKILKVMKLLSQIE